MIISMLSILCVEVQYVADQVCKLVRSDLI